MPKGDGAGRPTEMTDEILAKIKEGIVSGKPLCEMAEPCGLSESTLYDWTYKNYGNFADKLENWKLQAKLKKAEERADEIMALPLEDGEGKIDSAILRTIQKEAEFIRETLAKHIYSKRSEMSGPDGRDLGVIAYPINNQYEVPLETDTETDGSTAG